MPGEEVADGGGNAGDKFLESMAEAAKGVADYLGENVVYINVMNNLSVDCDRASRPAVPTMKDIGILEFPWIRWGSDQYLRGPGVCRAGRQRLDCQDGIPQRYPYSGKRRSDWPGQPHV